MDEQAFRQVRSGVVALPCPFARSILQRCASCALANRIQVAERELVGCQDRSAQTRCQEFHDRLLHSFSFALGKPRIDGPLPHAQEMRVQCGGLKGLQHTLDGSSEVSNVAQLLDTAQGRWHGLADLPYSAIVHAAALVYKGRRG
jgi:hypothetical protein